MTDAAARAEDHQILAGAELQLVLQPSERGDAIGTEGACLLGRDVRRYDRGLVFLDGHVLSVEPALDRIGIPAIGPLGSLDSLADSHDGSRAVVSKDFREALLAELELTGSHVEAPDANPCGPEPDENLVPPRLRDRKDVRLPDLRAAVAVDRGGLHRLGNEGIHVCTSRGDHSSARPDCGHVAALSEATSAPARSAPPCLANVSRSAGRRRR